MDRGGFHGFQRFDFTPQWQHQLVRYNAMMMDNGAGADGIVDYANDPIMGGSETRRNPYYYIADGMHPMGAGYAVLAETTARELRRHLKA